MKTLILITSILISSYCFAWELELKLERYPTLNDIQEIKKIGKPTHLSICCYYPSMVDLELLKTKNIKTLTIKAGYFPTAEDIQVLNLLNSSIRIELSEVFPSREDIDQLNKSNIAFVEIDSRDFPTTGEVQIFNLIQKPFQFNILTKEYPLPEHMIVIKQFKPESTVLFANEVPPGPGYANFFNDLKTHKIFKVINKFPYGDDAIGINKLEKSSIIISPDQMLLDIDIPTLSQIQIATLIDLKFHPEIDQDYLELLQKISNHSIKLNAESSSELLKSNLVLWADQQNNLILSFNQI